MIALVFSPKSRYNIPIDHFAIISNRKGQPYDHYPETEPSSGRRGGRPARKGGREGCFPRPAAADRRDAGRAPAAERGEKALLYLGGVPHRQAALQQPHQPRHPGGGRRGARSGGAFPFGNRGAGSGTRPRQRGARAAGRLLPRFGGDPRPPLRRGGALLPLRPLPAEI